MGRNIDIDDMMSYQKQECIKCKADNISAFEELDIDCYEFKEGICFYSYRCGNCDYENKVIITLKIENLEAQE